MLRKKTMGKKTSEEAISLKRTQLPVYCRERSCLHRFGFIKCYGRAKRFSLYCMSCFAQYICTHTHIHSHTQNTETSKLKPTNVLKTTWVDLRAREFIKP